jgi:hypothetical protein
LICITEGENIKKVENFICLKKNFKVEEALAQVNRAESRDDIPLLLEGKK